MAATASARGAGVRARGGRARSVRCRAVSVTPPRTKQVAPAGTSLPKREVPSPAQQLGGGVPLIPPKMTVEGGLADWLEAATAELQQKRVEGPLVDHLLKQNDVGAGVEGGLVAEFGVYRGSTLRRIAASPAIAGKTVYGFDSFEGFQEDWDLAYGLTSRADFFDLGGDLPGGAPENVELVRGYFNQSMPAWLEAHPGVFSFVHIDCDMYTSTRDVFTLAADRFVPGTVVCFDEFFCQGGDDRGEFTAFYEWAQQNGREFEFIAYGEGSHELMLEFPKFGDKNFVDKLFMAGSFNLYSMARGGKVNFETAVALRITA